MNEPDYERLLQRCLDERRDPLDDAGLVELAAADPTRIERLAALRARLAALAAVAAPLPASATLASAAQAGPRRSWRWWAVAAALTAAAGLLAAVSLRGVAAPAAAPALRGAIVSAELREIRPWARATAQFTVRQVLASGAAFQWETFEQRSEVR